MTRARAPSIGSARSCSAPPIGSLLLAAGLVACGGSAQTPARPNAAAPAASQAAEPPQKPRSSPLIVAIVIDQLPLWLAVERWKTLPKTGGFAKLLAEANATAELRFGHAYNATGPGHAALFTGGTAHDSGITTNGGLDANGKWQNPFLDAATKLAGPLGALDRVGSSIKSLKVDTVADGLRREHPNATIISLSMKDRAAMFGGGRKPDSVLWFDTTLDAFVSSTAFTPAVSQGWAEKLVTVGGGAAYRKEAWLPLDVKWLAANTDLPAPDIGQGDFFGLGRRFPHDFSAATNAPSAIRATPFADSMVLDLALGAATAIRSDDRRALLAISLSANDYVGHVFGPDAPEAWDQMLRLDAALGAFLGKLDQTFGSDGYAVVLSSDHGVSPTPEVMNQGFCGLPTPDRFERRCDRSIRLQEYDVAKAAEDAADKAVGAGDWIKGASDPFIVFTEAARSLKAEKRDKLTRAVEKALGKIPGVARTLDVRKSPASCPPLDDESLDALLCRSIDGSSGGDVYLLTKPGVFFDSGYVIGDGVNHGSPYLFDRAVPLIVRAPRSSAVEAPAVPAFDPKERVDHRAYAATLASFLGVAPPPLAKGGRDLSAASAR